MIKSFPKIFQIGQRYIVDIFDGEVEITEKIDGSQFNFGKINGELFCRSKGCEQIIDAPDKMFKIATEYVLSVKDKIKDNTIYHCEYLNKPKHNVLCYNRVPKNNLIMFGVSTSSEEFIRNYKECADGLDLETVPIIFKGTIKNVEELLEMLNNKSILGEVDIEGIVVKNYNKDLIVGDRPIPIMCGKYVSEKFKEVHQSKRKGEHTSKGKWEIIKESFRTEARWSKAVAHLRDDGKLEQSPRDIGNLMKEVKRDIIDEEKENIKNHLWKEFGEEVLRSSIRGLPEWYKQELVKNNFPEFGGTNDTI